MSDWKEEYREAGQNFRDGFKLMFEISKGFITINSFLFAAYAAINSLLKADNEFSLSIFLICIVGILASIGFTVAHWRIAHYLRDFVLRAKEIEDEHNFHLFNNIHNYEINGRSNIFNNLYIPMIGFSVIGIVWFALMFISVGVVNVSISL